MSRHVCSQPWPGPKSGPGQEPGLRAGLGGVGRLGEGERMDRTKIERMETRLIEHTSTITRVSAHFRAGLSAAAAP